MIRTRSDLGIGSPAACNVIAESDEIGHFLQSDCIRTASPESEVQVTYDKNEQDE